MEKNEACQGNREHVFGDSRFSFKPAGCHLQNNKNASKVVFLSISSNKEFSVHRKMLACWSQFYIDCSKALNCQPWAICHVSNRNPTLTLTHPKPTFEIHRVQIDFKKESQEEPEISWNASDEAQMSLNAQVKRQFVCRGLLGQGIESTAHIILLFSDLSILVTFSTISLYLTSLLGSFSSF